VTTPYYSDDRVSIWNADALALPIPDESVDLIVTSPPYFGLRSYTDGGEHYDGQIGSEATPGEFVDALVAATAEMVRVLKPSGSIFVNLGDKYAGGGGQWDKDDRADPNGLRSSRSSGGTRGAYTGGKTYGLRPKSLIGVPWRYALRCVDELGLILRAEVIWSKPNGLPESVTDRVRRSHETWFHLTREPRYFSAVDEIREEHVYPNDARHLRGSGYDKGMSGSPNSPLNPLGKLPGSVWEVPTQPLKVPAHLGIDHFAAFPMEWPRRIIRGWSPTGICVECGEGRRPLSTSRITGDRGGRQFNPSSGNVGVLGKEREYRLTGYACACDAPTSPTRPAVILDPFGGTGTTAVVAKALGRRAHLVDLSADYCRLAQWRVTDPGEMARAMQVEKPPPAPEDMDSLLDLLDLGGVA
jgi:DNA modification methylase